MVGMADGYAQASGRTAHRQPPHRARRRQRDGGDLQRAGQPLAAAGHRRPAGARPDDPAGEPDQPRRDPDAAPAGQVEPTSRRAPRTCRWRSPAASTSPRCRRAARSSSRSRWTTGTPRSTRPTRAQAIGRRVERPRRRRPRGGARRSPARLDAAENPVLVAGPDIDASGGWDAAVALAERQRLPVWATPAPGGGRLGFPEGHPNFRGVLPPAIGPVGADARGPRPDPRRRLLGLPLLPLHPRPAAARGRDAGRDHQRPRRGGAGADGRRDRRRRRADAGGAARGGAASRPRRRRSRSTPARPRSPPTRPAQPLDGPLGPRRGLPRGRRSSCSSRPPARWRCATSCASRAPAATTSAPAAASASASPPRSACSSPSPTARSSACSARARPSTRSPASGRAVAYEVPVTFLVLRNEEYAILKWFADVEQVHGRAGPRPAGARRRRGRRGLRRRRAPGRAGATSCATRWPRRSPPRSRSWSRSRSRPAWPSSAVRWRCRSGRSALAPDASEPAPDRAPTRWRAARAAAARRARGAARRRPRARPRERPRPLRLRRQPLPAASRRSW